MMTTSMKTSMTTAFCAFLIALALILATARSAEAIQITYFITGEVIGVFDNSGVSIDPTIVVGSGLTGSYSFESTTPGIPNPNPGVMEDRYVSTTLGSGMIFNIASDTYRTTQPPSGNDFQILVTDDGNFGGGNIKDRGLWTTRANDALPNGAPVDFIEFQLRGLPSTINNTSLNNPLLNPPDVVNVWTDTNIIFISGSAPGNPPGSFDWQITGRITNIIPEPSTFALATLGLMGIGCRRRKRA